MVLHIRLEHRQTQRIVITPQLRQAIKLLQLSALDLQGYLENEVRENPLLSLEESADAVIAPDATLQSSDIPTFDARDEAFATGDADLYPDGELADDSIAAPKENPVSAEANDWLSAGSSSSHSSQGEDYDPFTAISHTVSLADHLREQAQLAFLDAKDRFVADYLIDLVDDHGYLRASLEEVSELLGLEIPRIERVAAKLQTFDPAGVCARSLPECLALQLKERNRLDPLMERLLANLDLLAACDFNRLKKVCGADTDDLDDMIAEIRQLNPRPGSAFEKLPVETMVPDVIVRRGADGKWLAELNPSAAPVLAVDRAYYAALKSRCRSDKDRSYLSDRLSSANWLAKSLEQRLSTILKVATAIVDAQSAFFEHGVRRLKPLNLRQIAAKIGMHESTVSRVTSNKAMATPRGLLEMKYFFTSAIATTTASSGGAHSSEAVRHVMNEVISQERADEVLSDDKIVTLLKMQGIDIARRTVAKYREALGIPSSAIRRRQKRMLRAA